VNSLATFIVPSLTAIVEISQGNDATKKRFEFDAADLDRAMRPVLAEIWAKTTFRRALARQLRVVPVKCLEIGRQSDP
jgi:hypothetical protein